MGHPRPGKCLSDLGCQAVFSSPDQGHRQGRSSGEEKLEPSLNPTPYSYEGPLGSEPFRGRERTDGIDPEVPGPEGCNRPRKLTLPPYPVDRVKAPRFRALHDGPGHHQPEGFPAAPVLGSSEEELTPPLDQGTH